MEKFVLVMLHTEDVILSCKFWVSDC